MIGVAAALGSMSLAACGPSNSSSVVSPPPTVSATPLVESSMLETGSPVPSTPSEPTPSSPPLPYRADWSNGLSGWYGGSEWHAMNDKLLSTGTAYGIPMTAVAPLQLATTPNYTVEFDVQYLRHTDAGSIAGMASFGVVVRALPNNSGGYGIGHCVAVGIFSCAENVTEENVAGIWDRTDQNNPRALATFPFAPEKGSTYHFRVAAKGSDINVAIDGHEVLHATDNAYLDGGRIGLWTDRTQVAVSNFAVSLA